MNCLDVVSPSAGHPTHIGQSVSSESDNQKYISVGGFVLVTIARVRPNKDPALKEILPITTVDLRIEFPRAYPHRVSAINMQKSSSFTPLLLWETLSIIELMYLLFTDALYILRLSPKRILHECQNLLSLS